MNTQKLTIPISSAQHRLINLLKMLGVTVLYTLLAELVIGYSATSFINIIYPSSGLGLAAALIGGKRYALCVYLGALMINVIGKNPFWLSVTLPIGSALEALLGAWMLTRNNKQFVNLNSLGDYLRLTVLAGAMGSGVAALPGATILLASGTIPAGTYFQNMAHWWMGDALGIIMITPLILVWRRMPVEWFAPQKLFEVALVFGLTFLVGQIIFLGWFHEVVGLFAKGFLMFLLITLTAVRLGTHGTMAALMMISVQGLAGAITGTGYFANDMAQTKMTNYWLYIVTLSLVGMALAIYISEKKCAEEEIKLLAFYDPLTALPNRRLLLERLKHGIQMGLRDGKQMALMTLDLDRFKAVNDSFGHGAGDELLKQVAERLSARLREVDMVARLGGDEFMVLLDDITHTEDPARVAEAIITDLSKPFQLSQGNDVQIGVSIGISLFPQHGDSPEILMNHADTALYKAKEKNCGGFAYFSEDLTFAARKRIALEARLRKAINQEELHVFYQPQVDMASGRIIGAEALVRWQDQTEGFITPDRFIPIAEETGLIMAIGEWILRETCRQGRKWMDAGLPSLMLAVNVSPMQFRHSDINAMAAKILNETGFPAKQLELELTENTLMENQNNAVAILNDLRAQGIRLAIDDFGTGYSSLAYLKHFPVDVLKIDKSFIDDIPLLKDDMEITATIIAMGHTLGFKVLAEGVETPEQLAFLRGKDCDFYQGHIKSKPVSAEDFAVLLRNQQRVDEAILVVRGN